MNSTLQLADLPVEILLMICDYLDVWELLSIRLTSKKMLEITQLPKLNDTIVLSLRNDYLRNDSVVNLFRGSFLKYTGLSIRGGQLFNFQEIFEKFGHDVKYMRLEELNFGDDNGDVPQVLELFPHLKELVLINCDRRLNTEINCIWPDLTSLILKLSDGFMPLLKQAHFPNLRTFHFKRITCGKDILDILADFLERHKATIQCLNAFESIELETSSRIAKTFREMNLKKLWMGSSQRLLEMMTKTSKLRYLNLSRILDDKDDPPGMLMDNLVAFISTNLRHLQHLDLNYCRYSLKGEHMIALSSLVDLRFLNISSCENISKKVIFDGIAKCKNERFLGLTMRWMPQIDQDAFIHCTQMFPNLQVLDVSRNHAVNDRVVKAICRNLTQLKKLDLSNCLSVTLKEVELQRLCRLEEIVLMNCRKITDVALIRGFKLSNLKKVDLDDWMSITYDGIKALVEGCPLLRELKLINKCFKDTCDGGAILEKISRYWSFEEQRWLTDDEQLS